MGIYLGVSGRHTQASYGGEDGATRQSVISRVFVSKKNPYKLFYLHEAYDVYPVHSLREAPLPRSLLQQQLINKQALNPQC